MTIALLIVGLGPYLAVIGQEARRAGVDADVLAVICYYETEGERDRLRALGDIDEMGLCQVRLQTARELGYRGSLKALLRPRVNARYAALWLAKCQSLGAAAIRQQAMCYNEGWFTPTSKTRYSGRIAGAVTALRMQEALRPRLAMQ